MRREETLSAADGGDESGQRMPFEEAVQRWKVVLGE